MGWRRILGRVRESRAFAGAMVGAAEYARDPRKLSELIERASKKADASRGGALREVWESLTASFRLLRAHARGEYTRVPWRSLLLVIASILYFVTPIDVIPDFLFSIGFLDDAALLAWTLRTVKADIDAFRAWEGKQDSDQ